MNRARRAAPAVVLLAVLALAVLGLARAALPEQEPSRREQVDAVAATLRCPTCQGLSVRDSSSVLAAGSRQVIEQQLAEGRSPDEVRQYFVDRYGEHVLLTPDPEGPGLLAWVLPAVAVGAGGAVAWRWLRRGRAAGDPATVDPAAVDPAAAEALAAVRAGRLVPDGSPAGEALREALTVRLAAEEDDPADAGALARADARLAAAARRYRARSAAPRPAGTGPVLPRRALGLATATVVLAAAVVGLGLAVRDRGTGDPATGGVPDAAAATSAPDPAALRAAAEASPEDPAAWLALGRAYDREQRYDEAVAAYDRALALEPADDVALMRGTVLVRGGRAAEALGPLTELAGRYPDDPDVLLVLGLAQEATGAPEAAGTLRRFLELAPDSPAVPGVRAVLEGR